jgi:hypothetical protein
MLSLPSGLSSADIFITSTMGKAGYVSRRRDKALLTNEYEGNCVEIDHFPVSIVVIDHRVYSSFTICTLIF